MKIYWKIRKWNKKTVLVMTFSWNDWMILISLAVKTDTYDFETRRKAWACMLCTWLLLSHNNLAMLAFFSSINWPIFRRKNVENHFSVKIQFYNTSWPYKNYILQQIEKNITKKKNTNINTRKKRTSWECNFLIATLKEKPITDTCPIKLFR